MRHSCTRILSAALLILVTACSTTPESQVQPQEYPEPVFSAERMLPDDFHDVSDTYDPLQGMNMRIYNFNYHFDQMIFLPVVRGYRALIPQFARTGLDNFFNNFADITTIANSMLQLAPSKAMDSTGRVLVNSTLGILGFIDVASSMGITRHEEDFGQTLGYWGVEQGPYLVLPLLGPSNLRDGIGKIPDYYLLDWVQEEVVANDLHIPIFLADAVYTRANTSFRYYETGSAFEYQMVRWLYSTKRKLDVAK